MYKLFFSEKNTGQMSKAQYYFGPYTEYLGHSVCLDNVRERYHKRCLYIVQYTNTAEKILDISLKRNCTVFQFCDSDTLGFYFGFTFPVYDEPIY